MSDSIREMCRKFIVAPPPSSTIAFSSEIVMPLDSTAEYREPRRGLKTISKLRGDISLGFQTALHQRLFSFFRSVGNIMNRRLTRTAKQSHWHEHRFVYPGICVHPVHLRMIELGGIHCSQKILKGLSHHHNYRIRMMRQGVISNGTSIASVEILRERRTGFDMLSGL